MRFGFIVGRLVLCIAFSLVTGWAAAAGKIFVANEGGTLSVIDARSYAMLATVPAGNEPHNVQVSPDGKRAWLTTEGEPKAKNGGHEDAHDDQSERGAIWAVDTQTYGVVAKIPVGLHPAHVVLTPDGGHAYVTNGGENSVSVVDIDAGKVVSTIQVGEFPHGIRISPDGREAYIANLKGDTVSVVDTATMKEVERLPVGKGPAQTGFTRDGRIAFVSLSGEDRVAIIDTATRKVMRKIPVGMGPIQLYASPDGRLLFVANQGTKQRPDNTVSVIDLATHQVIRTLKTDAGAHGVIVDPDGRYAFVTNIYEDSVSVIEVAPMKVVATVPAGKEPNGISFLP